MAKRGKAPAKSPDKRRTARGVTEDTTWFGRNWRTVLILTMLVFVALFVRGYFGYSPSVDNGFLVSGGSDSYFHQRVIEHVVETGQHLISDPLLNYPLGMRNVRPPLYDWSVAVGGMALSGLGMSSADAVGHSLVFSTAVWGALTVIPVFLIGREAFGRRAGLAGAFLFALMAGHITRSVLSNADHDAIVLFFGAFAFYFLLLALRRIKGDRWVRSWKDKASIKAGLRDYLSNNRVSMLYAVLAGIMLAAVAMTWKGFTYMQVIILAYLLLQLLINKFKNIDSLGVTVTVSVALLTTFLLSAPVYVQMNLWNSWFDVPLYLFLAGMVVGMIFTVTRDYPWTLVIPSFALFGLALLAAAAFLAPAIYDAIVTGQGYFVQSKIYSTISEAQAPDFSNLVFSFGVATFWLSFIGVFYAAWKVPKQVKPGYVFIVVWTAVSMFMAVSAGRFMFNASPAFAITGGWILAALVDKMDFPAFWKSMREARGNMTNALRRSVKARHVIGVLFLAFLVALPNAWLAIDAGIPSNDKEDYDREIYNAMPSFMRPSDYDSENGTQWYLGAFSYAIPDPSSYWPVAWDWFEGQDIERVESERPAFLSWWDYGFEAGQEGKHPSVADNFQNAYQFAGNFITAQSEEEAISLFIIRVLEGEGMEDPEILALLGSNGVDVARLTDVMESPGDYVDEVKANPDIYGNYDDDLSARNAKYIVASTEIAELGEETLVDLYNDLREITGTDIGYFAIDSRLFPFSALGFNIFYAPAKLSDHVIDDASNAPTDFYEIKAVDINGNYIDLEDVTADDQIINYAIEYKEMFYDSMLYRAFMGYGPSDIGSAEQGIPGYSGSLADLPSMQAWNMKHFKLVYRTAYYNPFPVEQVSDHPDAWRAISYDEAMEIQERIDAGEMEGAIDATSNALQSGVVFIQYYDGAMISGTVTSQSGEPYPDVRVTVLDEYGIPHDTVQTDAEGNYEVIAPFGEIELVYSYGDLDLRTQLGAAELDRVTMNITYSQAMRAEADEDGNGIPDYMIDKDISLGGYDLSGQVYWDMDSDGSFNAVNDDPIVGATVVVENTTTGFRLETLTTEEGYGIDDIPPMTADVYFMVDGHRLGEESKTLTPLGTGTASLGIVPAGISGRTLTEDGEPVSVGLELLDESTGEVIEQVSDDFGGFDYQMLLPGKYSLSVVEEGVSLGDQRYDLVSGDQVQRDFTLYDAVQVSGRTMVGEGIAPNAQILLRGESDGTLISSDAQGRYSALVPEGEYTVYVSAVSGGREYTYLDTVELRSRSTMDLPLERAVVLSGTVNENGAPISQAGVTMTSKGNGATFETVTNADGRFRASLPEGVYVTYIAGSHDCYWEDTVLTNSRTTEIDLVDSGSVSGVVWYDSNHDSVRQGTEGVEGVQLTLTDVDGRSISVLSGEEGGYELLAPKGKQYTLNVTEEGYLSYGRTFSQLGTATQDVQLRPENVTVSGTVSYEFGLGATEVIFEAQGDGAVTATAVTGADGSYSASLVPGDYLVRVNENVSATNATIYTYSQPLEAGIGDASIEYDIAVQRKVLVTGTVTPGLGVDIAVTISGPEDVELETEGSFEVYLLEGEYSVYAVQERLGRTYAFLGSFNVSDSSSSLAIDTVQSVRVSGDLEYVDEPLREAVPVTVTAADGSAYGLKTMTTGDFRVYLPTGFYELAVDHAFKETDGNHVRYVGSTSLSLASSTALDIEVERTLDNVTLSGVVDYGDALVSAGLTFEALDVSAIDATATATPAGYSVDIAPGNYSVYVSQVGGNGVHLGTLEVLAGVDNTFNVTLEGGFRLSGVVPGGEGAEVTFSDGGSVTVVADDDGEFQVVLPAGEYDVSASFSTVEKGVDVTYSGEFTQEVQKDLTRTYSLDKVAEHDIDLEWDEGSIATLEPGESVVYTVRVINRGNVPENITLSTTSSWEVEFSPSNVEVDFGLSNSELVTVTVTVPDDAKVSHSPIRVRADSDDASSTVDLDVDVVARRSVDLGLSEVKDTAGDSYGYLIEVENSGNIDDSYSLTIENLEQLSSLGWSVELLNGTGASVDSIEVAALKAGEFELRLTPTKADPGSADVVVMATSEGDATSFDTLPVSLQLPGVGVDEGGLTVSGEGIDGEQEDIPLDTIVLAGLSLTLTVLVILMSISRGVFKRKKR